VIAINDLILLQTLEHFEYMLWFINFSARIVADL